MLYIITAIFLILGIIFAILEKEYIIDDYDNIILIVLFSIAGFFLAFSLIVTARFNSIKSTTNSQIQVLEERNETVLKQVEPLVDKYMNYEKSTYSDFNINTLIGMYPELKSNELIKQNIELVINNQQQITNLKLERAKLNAYKLWIFMGE